MHHLPAETDPAWQPDPDGTWWFRGQAGPMFLADVQSLLSCFQRDQSAVFFRGGDPRPRRGQRALFGCWARPLGASGPGSWVDQVDAAQRWDDGWELYWPTEGTWSVKDPNVDTTAPMAAAPESGGAPPVDGQQVVAGPLDVERVINGVRFQLVEVDGQSVYVSEPSSAPMSLMLALLGANDVCKARPCTANAGPHAYHVELTEGRWEPTAIFAEHVHIANRDEIQAFWRAALAGDAPHLATTKMQIWVSEANGGGMISCFESSIEASFCSFLKWPSTFVTRSRVHFAFSVG